jgi:hypothetical protein
MDSLSSPLSSSSPSPPGSCRLVGVGDDVEGEGGEAELAEEELEVEEADIAVEMRVELGLGEKVEVDGSGSFDVDGVSVSAGPLVWIAVELDSFSSECVGRDVASEELMSLEAEPPVSVYVDRRFSLASDLA